MYDIKNILAPLNLADSNQDIAPYIRALAEKHKAAIHLIYTFQSFALYAIPMYSYQLDLGAINAEIYREAEKALDKFVEDNFPGLPDVYTAVVMGCAERRILDYAASNHIDLIVLASHDRKKGERPVLGKVAEAIIKRSDIPVLLVNLCGGDAAKAG